MQPTNWPHTLQPYPKVRTLAIKTLIKTLKIDGDSELLCLTPLGTKNLQDRKTFHLTATFSLQ